MTTAVKPRSGFLRASRRAEARGRRRQGRERLWPMSKYSATIRPPTGSMRYLALVSCQLREASGTCRFSVEQRPANAKAVMSRAFWQ
ncbi:hypothetical protein CCS38_32090 [Streptomyces purpurogeneiscleroticus]|nr:hypothetical protein [Streptomyces purpurogeneiscleroticus]